jgi:uncharacterized protein (TIGR02757 family)
LEALFQKYHHPERIGWDPLSWPRRFKRRDDREVVAFLSAMLAYGNVRQINASLRNLFGRLGTSPAGFCRNFAPGRSDDVLEGVYHRFNTARDVCATLHVLGQILREWGSIEAFWTAAQGADSNAPCDGETISDRAGRFIQAALALDLKPYFPAGLTFQSARSRPSFLYLFPKADGPSACKRLFMFLRWVVRPDDGIDLGLWETEKPARLEYPVDTHVHRIGGYLGATRRKSADARTRREITDFFRRVDPDDPGRFDFSLSRLGILRHCPPRSRLQLCGACELRPVCNQRL